MDSKLKLTVKDIKGILVGEVCIYKQSPQDDEITFFDLYKGAADGIPEKILGMNVRLIAPIASGLLDVQVF